MATDDFVISSSVDQILENLPIGSVSKAIGNNLYGINFRQTPTAVPSTKDVVGFTFFTRPQLNLEMFNITNYRGFYSLLTDNAASYQRYTRLMLDPRLASYSDIACPFIDKFNPFIPVLSNNIISLSGWPDLVAPVFTSPSGLYNEEHSFVDGVTNHFEAFDIDATFRNTKGNPIIYLFYIWIKYQTLVFEGVLNPYLDFITENEIDYNTRIYRIVLDQQKRYVTFIAATGASFPLNIPTGSLFDYNVDTPYNNKNSEINIRFRSMGFTAFEDILKYEFNRTTAIFNPDIRKILEHDESANETAAARDDGNAIYRIPGCSLIKLPFSLAMYSDNSLDNNPFYNLNFRVYPYINLYTNELEWWVNENRFDNITKKEFSSNKEAQGINDDVIADIRRNQIG
ncbi:MAG: hypothetical protein ACD_33C00034G0001 [uncultured bacterium]|nr:MAG: hypothetical protein ACD_33C00034G0001 [uncultured bacterium]